MSRARVLKAAAQAAVGALAKAAPKSAALPNPSAFFSSARAVHSTSHLKLGQSYRMNTAVPTVFPEVKPNAKNNKNDKQKNQKPEGINPKLVMGAAAAVIGVLGYAANELSKQKPVYGPSLAKNNPSVVTADRCKKSGTGTNAGRSAGDKVEILNEETGKLEYFYRKMPFNRQTLLREIVLGALARELLGNEAPRTLLYEIPVPDNNYQVQYGILSEALMPEIPHSNLEEYANKYYEDHQAREWKPQHLGVPIAFDALFAKTDCKLANQVAINHKDGKCYSIDHESGFRGEVVLIKDSTEALEYIGEYKPKTINEFTHEEYSPGLDTSDTPDQPLKSNSKVLNSVKNIFEDAIAQDIENGAIVKLYQNFINLPDERIKPVINQTGLLSKDEEKYFYVRIKDIKKIVLKFMTELKEQQEQEAKPSMKP